MVQSRGSIATRIGSTWVSRLSLKSFPMAWQRQTSAELLMTSRSAEQQTEVGAPMTLSGVTRKEMHSLSCWKVRKQSTGGCDL